MAENHRAGKSGDLEVVRTLAAPLRHEPPKIKGSRFIASLAPVASTTEAMAFVEARRAEFADATHNCFAWRIQAGEAFRYNDDGEPSGTAGRPMLQEIDGRSLERVVAVVTRYFGGTKLGTGGLVRAYGGAVAAALALAEIVEQPILRKIRLRHEYPLTGVVEGVLHAFEATVSAADYGADVRLEVSVPIAEAERLVVALEEATAGQIETAVID